MFEFQEALTSPLTAPRKVGPHGALQLTRKEPGRKCPCFCDGLSSVRRLHLMGRSGPVSDAFSSLLSVGHSQRNICVRRQCRILQIFIRFGLLFPRQAFVRFETGHQTSSSKYFLPSTNDPDGPYVTKGIAGYVHVFRADGP